MDYPNHYPSPSPEPVTPRLEGLAPSVNNDVDIGILLVPLSASATDSLNLKANKPKCCHICWLSSAIKSGEVALLLPENPERWQYALGSKSGSDVCLQTQTEEECWVNYLHCFLV